MLCVHGSPLYQWDRNRQLKIDSVDPNSNFEIHCCHKDDSTSLVVTPIIEGDVMLVNIPNILLQRSGFLRVYVVVSGDTIYDQSFYIMARQKPDDYIYTETEVLSYASLDARITRLEKGGSGGGGSGLPFVTSEDDGKVLMVKDGEWSAGELPKYEGEYEVTPSATNDATLKTGQKYVDADITVKKIPYYEMDNEAGGTTIYIGSESELEID